MTFEPHAGRVIPVLLLTERGLVKTRRFGPGPYVGDPLNALRIFNEKCVDEIAVLDIEASRTGRGPDMGRIKAMAQECFMPLAYGGGVSDLRVIERLVQSGVEKVIVNTAAVENPAFLSEAAREFGSSTMVASMDVRRLNGQCLVYTRSGTRPSGRTAADVARDFDARGAGEIVVQSIDRDGMRTGYDLDLIGEISKTVGISVIGCGGANDVADLRKVLDLGCSAAAGSLFVLFGNLQSVLITYPRPQDLGRPEEVWP